MKENTEKTLWSVDEQQYDDRHFHTLTLTGWFIDAEKKEYTFRLYGNEKTEINLPAPARFDRPDVSAQFSEIPDTKGAGFTVSIPELPGLLETYGTLELALVEDRIQKSEAPDKAAAKDAALRLGEKVTIWKKTSEELKIFCQDSLMEFHIDREEIIYKTVLAVEGWVLYQRADADSVRLLDASHQPIHCRIDRYRRPDVVEGRQLDEIFRSREMGFRFSVNLEELRGNQVIVEFQGDGLKKTFPIDVKKLKSENSPMGRRAKVLAWENKDQNIAYIKEKGLREFVHYVNAQAGLQAGDYEEWLFRHSVTAKERHRQRRTVFPNPPLISIVIPLYNTPLPYLKEVISSIRRQTYRNWQLCLADGSEKDEIQSFLRKNYGREKRISYRKLKENKGISQNTNAAIALAKGDYILLCDHDDVLTPDALFEIAMAIYKYHADVVYTDEDKISMDGKHYFEPNFKPDFNLFRLRENNYICHIFTVKKELLEKAGLFQSEFDGAQDFDLILRCCEKAEKIVHVPKVLYHWRHHMSSTAADPASKAYAFEAGRKAVLEHYRRMGIQAQVESTDRPGWYRSHVAIEGNPLVSIIIPNKDHIGDLELCLSSIAEKSTYENYEILIAENNSESAETFAYYEKLPEKYPKARVLTWTKEFNYSAINNFAAEQAKGEYFLFLNNDVEVITPSWIEEMLQICQQKQVGIVGAKLYYPDDTIQHAGVVLGLGGIAGHIMCRALRSEDGYMGRMVSVQEISAVTAACMLVKKEIFVQAEGFDEGFQVAFNDIDLCMKVRKKKKKVVFTPYAELYHYESKSRGMEDTPEKQYRFSKETKRFQEKWAGILAKGDPYYSPNLSLTEGDCSLRE